MSDNTLFVELLAEHHEKCLFSCGEYHLDRYLQLQANQDTKRHLSKTYVLVQALRPSEIIGFYSMSTTSMRLTDLPEHYVKKLPRYPTLPAMLIGRLAVLKEKQGQGLGTELLLDALERCYKLSKTIGSSAVVVEAKNNEALRFYKRYGFIPFCEKPDTLFLPMKTIAQLFAQTVQKSAKKQTIA